MKKRCLSILLALLLCLSLAPVAAFAASDEPLGEPVEEVARETKAEQAAVEKIQALIDALPDADTITEENRADVEARLTAIDEAKLPLGDELDALDFTKYNDAIAALNELDGMGGAEVPEMLEDTLQGNGTEADPWILTQDSFTKAGTDESPVSAATNYYLLPSGSYQLGENINLNKTIQIGENASVTLDLNGHTLTQTNSDQAIEVSGTLTLNDSSDEQSGAISGGEFDVKIYGTFNMTGGRITSINNYRGEVTLPKGITLKGNVSNTGDFSFAGNTFEGVVQHGVGNAEHPIDGGTFLNKVENGFISNGQCKDGLITGGVFYSAVENFALETGGYRKWSIIRGGVFYGVVTNIQYDQSAAHIEGGVFYEKVINQSTIDGVITSGVFLGGIEGVQPTAQTHNITVDFGNGTTRNGIVVGDKLYPLGESPVQREGYKFVGWYMDAEFTEPWDFTNQNSVEDNMAFYAKWVCAGHTGGTATCQAQAECSVCGEEYGEVNAANHTALKHVEPKAATTEAEGNIEYWRCGDCGKYFSDKGGENEIALADTVIAKLTPEPTATPAPTAKPAHSPKTGDEANVALWLALGLSAALALGYVSTKKKEN